METSHIARGSPRGADHRRGGSRGRGQKRKREMGRAEWSRKSDNKRARHEEGQRSGKQTSHGASEKDLPIYATKYSAEEIAAQERRPKRKVAVMIGYSGTGYKGMQLNHHEKTIEGDLFRAFVQAGAISKANADDPKKSSLVRCARTDKGVHAAGNVISLKLVIEDVDVVTKINEALPPQIRVWGVERTNASFSAYQLCDSRIYEYLIPTYCFLPPHPESFLGKKIVELAERETDTDGLESRQEEVANFWSLTNDKYLNPIIEAIDPSIKDEVLRRFYHLGFIKTSNAVTTKAPTDKTELFTKSDEPDGRAVQDTSEPQVTVTSIRDPSVEVQLEGKDGRPAQSIENIPPQSDTSELRGAAIDGSANTDGQASRPEDIVSRGDEIEQHLRKLKAAVAVAKRAWRLPRKRLDRIKSVFSRYVGSIKYHNYTVDKTWSDASATRVIKSFKVDDLPVIIGNTEWLSLKVHGQSFMMHQIRKMVSSAALIVRCGCHEGRIQDTFLENRISIPKAPSLGLLLERPVFDKYNDKLIEFGREPIEFGRYEKEVTEFKQREIYERIFQDEEKDSIFSAFFSALDSTRSASLLWLTSAGLQGTQIDINKDPIDGAEDEVDLAKAEDDESEVAEDS